MPTMTTPADPYQIGDTITVKLEVKELADKAQTERKDAALAFREAVRWMNDVDHKFWEIIRQAHPELKGYDLTYRSDGTIVITGLKETPDD